MIKSLQMVHKTTSRVAVVLREYQLSSPGDDVHDMVGM